MDDKDRYDIALSALRDIKGIVSAAGYSRTANRVRDRAKDALTALGDAADNSTFAGSLLTQYKAGSRSDECVAAYNEYMRNYMRKYKKK